jgi:glutamate-5-semialdehyde dehydrogenase
MAANDVKTKAAAARAAAIGLAKLSDPKKRAALRAMAAALRENKKAVLAANAADVAAVKKLVGSGKITVATLKRLAVDEEKIESMALGVESVAKLPDPVGKLIGKIELDRGLILEQVSCPIGVIGAIFEARPDVVPQIASLCLKSGNAVLFKGGSEASRSNEILYKILREASEGATGAPKGWMQLMETREQVRRVLALDEYIDLLVPRGSNEFVRFIKDNTRIPVLGHADGICHVYIHSDAREDLAVAITLDSKTQYPAVCNAAETLLVHRALAKTMLPKVVKALQDAGVEVRGCPRARRAAAGVKPAAEKDWSTEYLDMIISIKVVDGIDEAIGHINKYGSGHTDAIVARSNRAAKQFFESVDSACVFWNASTRFSDGFRFGKGAEIGISTNKTHARGPVGLEGLVIYNYRLSGSGQIVDDYEGPHAKKFTHRKLK